jgi:hypothetical protein
MLFYFTQRSLLVPAASVGSAVTVVGITNLSTTTATRIAVTVHASSCASTAPLFLPLAPRQTLRLVVGELASPSLFPEGWVDVWAVDNAGVAIRFDQLAGKGTLLDLGRPTVAAATYAPAALSSDEPNPAFPGSQGGPILNHNSGLTWGTLQGSVDFWGLGGPFAVEHRLIVIPVAVQPGASPTPEASSVIFFPQPGGEPVLTGAVSASCMLAQPLSALHPNFGATFPGGGSLTEGGSLLAGSGGVGNKGIVGALLEFSSVTGAIAIYPLLRNVGPAF